MEKFSQANWLSPRGYVRFFSDSPPKGVLWRAESDGLICAFSASRPFVTALDPVREESRFSNGVEKGRGSRPVVSVVEPVSI